MNKWNFSHRISKRKWSIHHLPIAEWIAVLNSILVSREGLKYEPDEYIVEQDMEGMPIKMTNTSYSTQQHHILCVNEPDPNDYHSEQIEIHEYDEEELEQDEEVNETATPRSEPDRSQQSIVINAKASTSSQAHNNGSDERFLLSCLPNLQRLSNKKNQLARLKIQQLLYDIEFSDDHS